MEELTSFLLHSQGLGSFAQNSKLPKLSLAYALVEITLNVVGGFMIIFYVNLSVNCDINSMSRVGFWIQYYGKLYLATCILIQTIRNRDQIRDVHGLLKSLYHKADINKTSLILSRRAMVAFNLIIFLFSAAIIVVDCVLLPESANFFVIWTAHMPGLTTIVYITYIVRLIFQLASFFHGLNVRLRGHCLEKSSVPRLHYYLKIYDTGYKISVKLNRIYGGSLMRFMLLSLHGVILLLYVEQLELFSIRNDLGVFYREHHFTEYWIVVYLISFMMHHLKSKAGTTQIILHELRTAHRGIAEETLIHSFQLDFSPVQTYADSFFDLDLSSLVGFIGLAIKYLFILMQFDRKIEKTSD